MLKCFIYLIFSISSRKSRNEESLRHCKFLSLCSHNGIVCRSISSKTCSGKIFVYFSSQVILVREVISKLSKDPYVDFKHRIGHCIVGIINWKIELIFRKIFQKKFGFESFQFACFSNHSIENQGWFQP